MEIINRAQAARTRQYRLTYEDVHTINDRHPLERVAFRLWGDETLWYLIADVNPVREPADWSEGETIRLPLDSSSTLSLARNA